MSEFERILMECRYLLSLNKNYNDLALIFHISEKIVYDDLNNKLPKMDTLLYRKVKDALNNQNRAY